MRHDGNAGMSDSAVMLISAQVHLCVRPRPWWENLFEKAGCVRNEEAYEKFQQYGDHPAPRPCVSFISSSSVELPLVICHNDATMCSMPVPLLAI